MSQLTSTSTYLPDFITPEHEAIWETFPDELRQRYIAVSGSLKNQGYNGTPSFSSITLAMLAGR